MYPCVFTTSEFGRYIYCLGLLRFSKVVGACRTSKQTRRNCLVGSKRQQPSSLPASSPECLDSRTTQLRTSFEIGGIVVTASREYHNGKTRLRSTSTTIGAQQRTPANPRTNFVFAEKLSRVRCHAPTHTFNALLLCTAPVSSMRRR